MLNPNYWTLDQALPLIRNIEEIAALCDCHVALTGGVLYKSGERKDLDLLFYRVRQVNEINMSELLERLYLLGITVTDRYGWVIKATWDGKSIDMFFPEENSEIGYPIIEPEPHCFVTDAQT